jgi:chromosome segregation ATPase
VSAELAAAEADLSSQQRRVDSLELKLPDLNSQHEQFMARQAQLRQQAQALSADMSAVQAEAERVAREKEEKERLG